MTDVAERREFGTLRLRGRIWWLRYRVGGREHEESSHSTSRREAQKLLDKRHAELSVGIHTAPDTKRVTFTDLVNMVRNDYKVRGRRSLDRLEISLAHLERYFGACRALSITSDRITSYERERLDSGASRSTVNAELAALRRAFTSRSRRGVCHSRPSPPFPPPTPTTPARDSLRSRTFGPSWRSSPSLRPAMEFAYWTGWRIQDEVLALSWAQVDSSASVVRLEENTTKSGKGRTFARSPSLLCPTSPHS